MNQKTLLEGRNNIVNPFYRPEDDSLLVSSNNNLRGTLFLNRSKNIYALNYTYRRAATSSLLSFGVESRIIEENTIDARHQIVQYLDAGIHGASMNKSSLQQSVIGEKEQSSPIEEWYDMLV